MRTQRRSRRLTIIKLSRHAICISVQTREHYASVGGLSCLEVWRGAKHRARLASVDRQGKDHARHPVMASKDQYIQLMIFSPCRWSCPAIRLVNASCVFWWDIVATIVCWLLLGRQAACLNPYSVAYGQQ